MRKSFGLELHGEWSESADECFGPSMRGPVYVKAFCG